MAQGPDKSSSQPALASSEQCAAADANRSPNSWAKNGESAQARGLERNGDYRRGCSPVAPDGEPPPPPDDPLPPPPPPAEGTAWIAGALFEDAGNVPGLPGWTVELSGPVAATTLTDGSGSYRFSDLPPGRYKVCQRIQTGWIQTYPFSGPLCPTGVGYEFDLVEGKGAIFNDFLNVRQ